MEAWQCNYKLVEDWQCNYKLVEGWQCHYKLVEAWQCNSKLVRAWQCNFKLVEACNLCWLDNAIINFLRLDNGNCGDLNSNYKLVEAWQCIYKLLEAWQCNYKFVEAGLCIYKLVEALQCNYKLVENWKWSVQKGFKRFCGFHLKESGRPWFRVTKYNQICLNSVEKICFGELFFVWFYNDNFHICCLAGGAALGDDPPGGVRHRGSRSPQSPQTAHHPGPESQTGGPHQTDEHAILVPTNCTTEQ